MLEQESVITQLSTKVNDLLKTFEELQNQNENFRQEIVTLRAQSEAKSIQISKLEEELAQKNQEADDILGKIEAVLKK
jgi:uncharacterized coiled-coil DUF342 family protein